MSSDPAIGSTTSNSDPSRKKKRLRPVVVCTHCRKRKIKCDKQMPCSNCVKVNIGDSCTYDPHLERKPGDEFKMELQLPLGKDVSGLSGPSQGFVGQFTVENGHSSKKRKNGGSGRLQQGYEPANGAPNSRGTGVNGLGNGQISGVNGLNGIGNGLNSIGNGYNGGNGHNSGNAPSIGTNGNRMNEHTLQLLGVHPGQNQFPQISPGGSSQIFNGLDSSFGSDAKPNYEYRMVDKTELEFLKERLHNIERSLLGSAPRAQGSVSLTSSMDLLAHSVNGPQSSVSQTSGPVSSKVPVQIPPLLIPSQVSRMLPVALGPMPKFPLASSISSSVSLVPLQMHPPGFPIIPYQYSGNALGEKSSLPPLRQQSLLPPLKVPVRQEDSNAIESVSNPASVELVVSPPSVSSNANLNSSTAPSTSTNLCDTPNDKGYQGAEDFLIGTNIYDDPNDTMNFYENYSSVHYKDPLRRISFGPFAWSSLMRRDNGLRLIWDSILEQKSKSTAKDESTALMFAQHSSEITQETANTILSADKFTDQLETQFQKRALETDGYDDLIPYNSILKARRERNIQKQNLNRCTLPLGLTFYDGQIDRELQLIDKIQVVLPKKRVVWKLIHRYFTWVYTYMPFLDEEYFRRDVAHIIGPPSMEDEPIKDIKIEKKLDLATVGILLIVLRLAYLSLFSNNSLLNEEILNSNDPSHEIQGPKYLMRNPININTIEVAQLCLDQFQVFRRTNFTVMQLALYLRIYHTYAPEDGDGADGGDSQVLNAVLIQMAYSLGLNREPDEQCKDLKINNLSRKIWNYLVMSDVYMAYSFGNPMNTDAIYWDTKLPSYTPGGENIIDKDRDRFINQRFASCGFLFPVLRDLLKLCLDINSRVPLPELCSMLSKVEVEWFSRFGTLKDCIKCNGKGEPFAVERNLKVKIYLAFKAFLYSIYFHIYLYYEAKSSELSFFYLKKCLLTSTSDIMPHYSALLGQSEVISDMIINPTLEVAVHKSNMVYLSAMVRVNFIVFHMRQNDEHNRLCKEDKSYLKYFQLLCQVSSCLTRAAEYTISAISKISNRYYYAWRIAKGQTFLLKTITSTKFYEENFHNAQLLYALRYSTEQLEEIVKICESTLSKYRHSEFCTYGFSKHADKLYNCSITPDSVRSDGLLGSSSSVPTGKLANLEIDKLWLQVLSMKHDQLLAGNYQDGPVDAKTPMASTAGPYDKYYELPRPNVVGLDTNTPAPNDIDRFGYDMEMSDKFDLFSDMPFDQMFNFQ